MLKPKWIVAFALLLVLGLASSILAGPKRPQWGDSDIVEGIKQRIRVPRVQVYSSPPAPLVVYVPVVGRIVLLGQEQREMPRRMAKRLPAASRTERNLR